MLKLGIQGIARAVFDVKNLTVSTSKKMPIQHILTVRQVYTSKAAASSPKKQTVLCELWKEEVLGNHGGRLMNTN